MPTDWSQYADQPSANKWDQYADPTPDFRDKIIGSMNPEPNPNNEFVKGAKNLALGVGQGGARMLLHPVDTAASLVKAIPTGGMNGLPQNIFGSGADRNNFVGRAAATAEQVVKEPAHTIGAMLGPALLSAGIAKGIPAALPAELASDVSAAGRGTVGALKGAGKSAMDFTPHTTMVGGGASLLRGAANGFREGMKPPAQPISPELSQAASGTPFRPSANYITPEQSRAASGTPGNPAPPPPRYITSAESQAASGAPIGHSPNYISPELSQSASGTPFKTTARYITSDESRAASGVPGNPGRPIRPTPPPPNYIPAELSRAASGTPNAPQPIGNPADYTYQGKPPARVFHGTNQDFDQFDPSKATVGEHAKLGPNFSEDPEFANRFAIPNDSSGPRPGNQPNVRPAALNVKKPIDIDAYEKANPGKSQALTPGTIRGLGYDSATREEPMTVNREQQMRRTWIPLDNSQIEPPWKQGIPSHMQEVTPQDRGGLPVAEESSARDAIVSRTVADLKKADVDPAQLQQAKTNAAARSNLENIARQYSKQGSSYRMSDKTLDAILDGMGSPADGGEDFTSLLQRSIARLPQKK